MCQSKTSKRDATLVQTESLGKGSTTRNARRQSKTHKQDQHSPLKIGVDGDFGADFRGVVQHAGMQVN